MHRNWKPKHELRPNKNVNVVPSDGKLVMIGCALIAAGYAIIAYLVSQIDLFSGIPVGGN